MGYYPRNKYCFELKLKKKNLIKLVFRGFQNRLLCKKQTINIFMVYNSN